MEYIKKEELIEGEIYYVSTTYGFWMIGLVTKSNNGDNSNCDFRGNATFINKRLEFNKDQSWCYKGNHRTYRLATSEEKHWLNEAIRLDKFITFEEAIKTFIPEYYQYIGEIDSYKSSFIKGKTYKIINKNDLEASFNFIDEKGTPNGYEGVNWKKFKPSTKEAYDAQFVVKEPEFVLPEKWCVKTTLSSKNILQDYLQNNIINYPEYLKTWEVISDRYFHNKGHGYEGGHSSYKIFDGFIEITFEQFKKYVLKDEIVEKKVIEPLPQFKIIETIETITKVENNEGNQFFIGDTVKSNYSEVIHNIKGFKYNVDKTNILAITEKLPGGIGIDKIEHYIEPKTDYQILEYKTEGGISCKAPFLADSHQFYINERCKIYSIKRISDDLIITVGDEILSKTCGVPNKILSIELINNKIRLYPRNSFYNLEDILKINNK